MNDSVIRRYTPPTCTLNLLTKKTFSLRGNPLSDLRFELRFDDPKLPDHKQVLISGERDRLERLSDVVSRYVQDLLQRPLAVTAPAVGYTAKAEADKPSPSPPHLRSGSLLAHELIYERETIQLSTLQLFDLANALETYREDMVTLPQLESAKIRKRYAWAGVAAAIALFSIPVGVRLLTSSEADEPVVLRDIETQPRQPDPVEVIPPIPPPPPDVLPSPTLAPPLADSEQLQPPASVTPPPPAPLPTPPDTPIAPAPSSPQPTSVTPQTPPSTPPNTAASGNRTPSAATSPSAPPNTARSSSAPTAPELPERPPLQPQPAPPTPAAALPDAPAGDVAPNALLDEIPQVAEVRTYFQEQWSPPENLSQILEYRLVLNSDGSIKQITPLGQASRVYLDRTGMPLMGEEFVSSLSGVENPQIRVMLDPNGTVRTFLEAP